MNKGSPPPAGCDREVFSRVWARASTHDRDTSPIEVLPPTVCLPAAVAPPGPIGDGSASLPCFGRVGGDHISVLETRIREELEARQIYRFLSSRSAGAAAGILAAMAADEERHARRLSAVCFLLTGRPFFPRPAAHLSPKDGFWSQIRQRFWAEQRAAAAYTSAAKETSDPCLSALYLELAAEESGHADRLRTLVEKMPMR